MYPSRTTWLLPLITLLACSGGTDPVDDDDDDSAPAVDDDDATDPPDPLAERIGVFTLSRTTINGDADSAWVDFSGGFGTFAGVETDTVSVGAYLGTFNLGADVPYWRWDLGSWPLPALGEGELINLLDYLPWTPANETWWDAGDRVGLGNYLSLRADFESVSAYQVDDPLSPGNAAWTPGASLSWQNEGADPVVGWAGADALTLPMPAQLVEPAVGADNVVPAALPMTVRWTPRDDGATVTVGVLRDLGFAYIAQEEDDGEATIPGDALHEGFGEGIVQLFVARTISAELPHPQGAITVRARDEARVPVRLLPDVVIEPPFAAPGETVDVLVQWFTGDFDLETTAAFGEGVVVDGITPDSGDPHAATVTLSVDVAAELGGRAVELTSAADSIIAPGAFAVLNLPPQDTCADADAGAPLDDGVQSSSTVGLRNDLGSGYACLEWALNGADAIYAVELEAGEVLSVLVANEAPADAALALLSECDPGAAVACVDDGFEGDPEELVYRATDAGTYYLVVDGYHFSDAGTAFSAPFDLFVERSLERLVPAWIVPGDSKLFSLLGNGAWSGGLSPADLDPGDDIQVEALSVSADPTLLDVRLAAAPDADPGPRTLAVDTEAFLAEDALWVTELPLIDSCAEAQTADPLGSGSWTAFAPGSSSTIDEYPGCFTWLSPGPEVFLPLDLQAGQTVDVDVTDGLDLQIVMMSDCTDPDACAIGVDDGFDGDPEALVDWEVPADGRYYLVLDNFAENPSGAAWGYTLTVNVE